MNRWPLHPMPRSPGAPLQPSLLRRQLATAAFAVALCPVALAQSLPKRAFPDNALRAQMLVVNAHEVTLNGTLTRLSPGSRIRTATNALVVSGGLVGQSFVVNYTRDSMGQAHEIWVLNAAEAADRRPGSEDMTSTNIVSGNAATATN